MANDLQAYLIDQIKQQGPMALGTFIKNAMMHSRFGYYANESTHPIGRQGDFITAPEVSQMFGEMIGAWIIDTWEQMGGGKITLIECGPGRGTLMADILRVTQKIPEFIQKVHLQFVETSKSLRKAQKRAVQDYISPKRVSWSEALSQQKGTCIIIGNEFLDALPIEQVVRRGGEWYQQTIELAPKEEDGVFCFGEKLVDGTLFPFLPPHAQNDEVYEVSPARIRFIEDCLRIIKDDGGVALFIDYGHDKTHFGDTLQAVRKHEYTDILGGVGKTDITSHIDFESLSRIVKKNNVHCEPVVTQGEFLKRLGIEHRAQALRVVAKDKSEDIDVALDRLIYHKQMGGLFKVLCFYSEKNGYVLKPSGF